ncbi:MAG: hypothetical protein R2911_26940 [Caldilineaceae bacterium]
MLYSYDYSADYSPSMPMSEIMIGRARGSPALAVHAIVDSGADATMIPVQYLKQIGARRGKQVIIRSYLGTRERADQYIISFQLAHFARTELRVVGVTQTTEAVIGRDILNSLIVTLNGLASTVEIVD